MAVRESLLALLRGGPAHGYQLKADFEAATDGVWPLNVGQVYTTLDRLVRDGLVTSAENDGQKIYQLTGEGADALDAWWETTSGDEPPPRDELVLKVTMAASTDPATALDVVTRHRAALLQALGRRQRAGRGRDDDLAALLLREALVARTEADLRWLDRCEERLLALPRVEKGARR